MDTFEGQTDGIWNRVLHNIEFMGCEQGPSGLAEMSGIPELSGNIRHIIEN